MEWIDSGTPLDIDRPGRVDQRRRTQVGYFLTPEEHERLRRLEAENRRRMYGRANAVFTDQQLDAFDREGGELTYDEVKRHLESL
jgi:hypothetical protein